MVAETGETVVSGNGGAYRIEPLKGPENHAIWRIQIENIMEDMSLWEYVGNPQNP